MPGLTLPNLTDIATLLYSTSNFCLNVSLRTEKKLSCLPPEILREILLFALFSPISRKADALKTPVISGDLSSPFPLSQVCQQWRNIIIGSPALWSDIAIFTPSFKHLHRTELWLARSAYRNLNIVVRQSSCPTSEEIEATNKIVQVLSKHRKRWRNIHFAVCLPPASLAATLEDICRLPDSASQLREAYVFITLDTPTPIPQNIIQQTSSVYSYLNATQGLRKLTWKAPLTPHARFISQLQFLEIGSPIHARELVQGMVNCPRLIFLSARDVYINNDEPIVKGANRTELPNLVVLILTMREPAAPYARSPLGAILPRLALPSLTQLQLQHLRPAPPPSSSPLSNAPSDRTVVHALLAASRCRLLSLNVDIPDASPAELRGWLALPGTAALETLCLAGGTVDDSVLEALTWTHGDPARQRQRSFMDEDDDEDAPANRFRALRQLGLAVCAADVDEGVLLRMVGSRFWTPVEPGRRRQGSGKAELRTAHIWVRECTSRMEAYERMIGLCAERVAAWGARGEARELLFTVV